MSSNQKANSESISEIKPGLRTKLKRFFQKFELTAEAPQNLLTSGLWQIIGTFLMAILSWLLTVMISREDIGLGASGIGIFNTTLAIISIFTLLTVGMGKSTSQLVSANISDKTVAFKHARNGTFASIITGIIVGCLLISSSFFIGAPLVFLSEASMSTILFITGLVMLITGIRDALVSNLAAVGEYDEIAKTNAIGSLFQLLFGLLFVILIKNSILPNSFLLFLFLFGIMAQTLFASRYLKLLWFNTQIFRFNHVDRRFLKIMRQGFYFSITDLIPSGLLGSIILIILLIFTQGAYEYQIAGAFSIILGYSFGGLIVTGFAWPLITAVAEAYGKKDDNKIRYYLQIIVKIFFYLTFLILAIDISLSRGIIGVFHGSIYLTAPTDVWVPFIFVIAAFAVAGFEYILCGILLGVGKGRSAAVYLGSLCLVTIGVTCLCLWLDIFHENPQINASFGFLISTLIMLPFTPYLIKKHIQQKIPFSIGVRSLTALICTIAVAALLTWPPLNLIPLSNVFLIILMGLLFIILYLLLLIFFGAISQADFQLLERKAGEYGLKNTIDPLLKLLRKLMRISPFCEREKCLEPQ
jgi:O-antigen/teichoic acid export membrane protein